MSRMIPRSHKTKEQSVIAFIEAACEKGPHLRTSSADLLPAYNAWREREWDADGVVGLQMMLSGFGRAMCSTGIPRVKIDGKTVFLGIAPVKRCDGRNRD